MKEKSCNCLRLVLGDQLNPSHSWFQTVDDGVVYCFFETYSEVTYVRHHVQKVVGFFLAMRAFADQLAAEGHRVIYRRLDETMEQPTLVDQFSDCLEVTGAQSGAYQLPDEYRLDQALQQFAASAPVPIQAVDSEHFLSERNTVAELFAGKKSYLMETFYREMRRRQNILMTPEGKPITGKWNYDQDNRGKLKRDVEIPQPMRFIQDVSSTVAILDRLEIPTIGRIDPLAFDYPVTRGEALAALEDFCENRLVYFGTYQDAMTVRDPLLFHSRLSFVLNVKLISPLEVVAAAIAAWRQQPEYISFNQLEGFVRQIVGWREYMRGVYWAKMPAYEKVNFFDHQRALPQWFWTGETKMNCLAHAIQQSLDTAYAHHIQRLMVTGNFALLLGVHPDEVDAWYLGIYIDALQWVEITNTRGMSQWADGGLLATKPYVSSANYIHKMSDYCQDCCYNRKEKTGDNACPFNSLYWDFLDRHAEKLRGNFRMKMIYRVWDKFDAATKAGILQQAAWVKEKVEEL